MKCKKLVIKNSSQNYDKIINLIKTEGIYQDSPGYIWILSDFIDDYESEQSFQISNEEERIRLSDIFIKYDIDFYGVYIK